jgi:PX domain
MIIRIISFEQIPEEKYYVYHLHIEYKDWSNTICKRYNEFLELHKVMKLIHQNTGASLPDFPAKMKIKQFFHIVTEKDMENRRIALESYMKYLESGEITRHSRYFVDFIGLPMRLREEWLLNKPVQTIT